MVRIDLSWDDRVIGEKLNQQQVDRLRDFVKIISTRNKNLYGVLRRSSASQFSAEDVRNFYSGRVRRPSDNLIGALFKLVIKQSLMSRRRNSREELIEVADLLDGIEIYQSVFHEMPSKVASHKALTRPAPAYMGVQDSRVALIDRECESDDQRVELRSRLVHEQKRLATWFHKNWSRSQVDQRLAEHIKTYKDILSNEHPKVNIFSVDDEFRAIRRGIGTDIDALGEIGSEQWKSLERNHVVLTELYPEMREYREALAKLNPTVVLPEIEAAQAIAVLETLEAREVVAPEVPARIRQSFEQDVANDPEESRKRTYDVAALAARTGGVLHQLIEILPKFDKAADAATALWGRYWPILKELLMKMDWL